MWALPAEFGKEQDPSDVFLSIIANRYALVKGTQLIRDELMLSFNDPSYQHEENWATLGEEATECGADLSLPSVLTTCGYTMCGDRICQSQALRRYQAMVAGRFGSMTEGGEVKPELFFATGGGTDSGPTLAHVTVGHALDPAIRRKLYAGNRESVFLVNIDVCTHCGHLDIGEDSCADFQGKNYEGVTAIYGLAQESMFRDPRPCCGAIVGMLTNFNLANPVHVRLRTDLGEENWNFLSKNDVLADDGTPVRFLIAAAIIAIQGMRNTLDACGPGGELDSRGIGHMTAQVQVNNLENKETILYCARATVYNGEIREQGLGTDARLYEAMMMKDGNVKFSYDGKTDFPVTTRCYQCVLADEAAPPVPASPAVNHGDENAVDINMTRSFKARKGTAAPALVITPEDIARADSSAVPPTVKEGASHEEDEDANGSFAMGSLGEVVTSPISRRRRSEETNDPKASSLLPHQSRDNALAVTPKGSSQQAEEGAAPLEEEKADFASGSARPKKGKGKKGKGKAGVAQN
eukprot:CAMPEP_0177711336 /NCGR_PEP_ID=MMETSP0484_2-20121128/11807_1 /TAXON_ID=354590 /ORGANISM="Rhodomonas lens, Strain RHODO" /LENGTH=522 /DNA_ID=CAMNT_0019223063 /DNA_START=126 /DNA_END=1695 /DNA_ORIENTATION=+